MKRKCIKVFAVIQLIILMNSCDIIDSRVSLISGYEHNVIVHSFFAHNGETIEDVSEFFPGMDYMIDARGHTEHRYLVALKIENTEGALLAEYRAEYLNSIREKQDEEDMG